MHVSAVFSHMHLKVFAALTRQVLAYRVLRSLSEASLTGLHRALTVFHSLHLWTRHPRVASHDWVLCADLFSFETVSDAVKCLRKTQGTQDTPLAGGAYAFKKAFDWIELGLELDKSS